MFLSEPFKLDGEAVEKPHYDFSTITGRDAMRITAKLKQDGLLGDGNQQNDSNYQAAVFAAACGMELADLYRLPIADVNQAGKYAQLFCTEGVANLSAGEIRKTCVLISMRSSTSYVEAMSLPLGELFQVEQDLAEFLPKRKE